MFYPGAAKLNSSIYAILYEYIVFFSYGRNNYYNYYDSTPLKTIVVKSVLLSRLFGNVARSRRRRRGN